MKKQNFAGTISFIVSMSFIAFFIIGLLLLTMVGINYYSNITQNTTKSYHMRVSLMYLTNKLRQNDAEDAVAVEEKDGYTVLVISENVNGEDYETRIFANDGMLLEDFCKKDTVFDVKRGLVIAQVDRFVVSIDKNDLLHYEVGDNLQTDLALQSKGVRE